MTSWGSLVCRPRPSELGDPPESEGRVHNAPPTQKYKWDPQCDTSSIKILWGSGNTSLQPRMRMSLGYLPSWVGTLSC